MSKFRWTILLVASMAGIATIYPITKALEGTVDAYLFAFLRFSVAATALLPVMIYRHSFSLPRLKEIALLAFLAVCAVLPTAFIFMGVGLTNSVVAAILINTNPLIVALLAPFLIGEHVTNRKAAGLALGFLGVLSVVLNGQNPLTDVNTIFVWGCVILLFAALLSALNKVYSKDLVRKYDGLYVTFFAVVFGAVFLAIIVAFRDGFAVVSTFTAPMIAAVLTIGIIATAIPWVIWSSSLKHLEVHVAATFNLLIPVFAVLYSFVFFAEDVTLWTLLGLILVSCGIYVVQRDVKVAPHV